MHDDGFGRNSWQTKVRTASKLVDFISLLSQLEEHLNPGAFRSSWKLGSDGWTHEVERCKLFSDVTMLALVLDASLLPVKRKIEAPSGTTLGRPSKSKRGGAIIIERDDYKSTSKMEGDDDDGLNQTECYVCKDGGEVLCCDFCPSVVHKHCLSLEDQEQAISSESDWKCPKCHSVRKSEYKNDRF